LAILFGYADIVWRGNSASHYENCVRAEAPTEIGGLDYSGAFLSFRSSIVPLLWKIAQNNFLQQNKIRGISDGHAMSKYSMKHEEGTLNIIPRKIQR
jgi:hypothetical protein